MVSKTTNTAKSIWQSIVLDYVLLILSIVIVIAKTVDALNGRSSWGWVVLWAFFVTFNAYRILSRRKIGATLEVEGKK
jgi:hypothetical protein